MIKRHFMESDEHRIIQHFSKLQGAHLETHVYIDAYGIVKLLKGPTVAGCDCSRQLQL